MRQIRFSEEQIIGMLREAEAGGSVSAGAGVSQRRAIRFTGFPSSTMRYRSVKAPQEELVAEIRKLAGEHPR